MKKHLVIVSNQCGERTIAQNVRLRAKYFSEIFNVTIISDLFSNKVDSDFSTVLINPKKYNYLHRFCHVPNDISFAYAARKALKKLYREKPIDFLICHSYSTNYFVGAYFKEKYDTPYSMFMHGHIFSRPKGTYDSRVTFYYKWLAPNCYSRSDLIFSLSTEQKNLAINSGASPEKVKLAPNGIDITSLGIDQFTRQNKSSFSDTDKPINILYVGRCSPEKGVEFLLDACEMLLSSGQKIRLQVIGGQSMSENIRLRLDSKPLSESLSFIPEVPREQLGKYYLECDIHCVPSIDEPLGNVVLEGMITGCMVVASHVGGIPDMIKHNETGLLFKPGSAQEIVQAVLYCRSHVDHVREMQDNARRFVTQNYRWDQILQKMQSDIVSVL